MVDEGGTGSLPSNSTERGGSNFCTIHGLRSSASDRHPGLVCVLFGQTVGSHLGVDSPGQRLIRRFNGGWRRNMNKRLILIGILILAGSLVLMFVALNYQLKTMFGPDLNSLPAAGPSGRPNIHIVVVSGRSCQAGAACVDQPGLGMLPGSGHFWGPYSAGTTLYDRRVYLFPGTYTINTGASFAFPGFPTLLRVCRLSSGGGDVACQEQTGSSVNRLTFSTGPSLVGGAMRALAYLTGLGLLGGMSLVVIGLFQAVSQRIRARHKGEQVAG